VQIARGNTLITVKGFGAPEVGQAYTRAQELSQRAGATAAPQFFPVLWGLWVNHFTRAEQQMGRGLGDQLLHLAQRLGDPSLLLQAHHALWTSCYFLGEFTSAQEHVEQGLAVYDPQQHHSHTYLYGGHDPGVCCLTLGAPILCCMGYPEQALQRSSEAAALARELSHPGSEVLTLRFLAVVSQFRREARAVQEWAEAAIALAAEHKWPFWTGWAGTLRGWALAQQSEGEAGIAQVRRALATFQATGTAHDVPYQLALLSEAYQAVGQTEEALSAVGEALSRAHDAGGCYYQAELYRLKGELLLTRSKGAALDEAEACFHQAIEVARRQSARSWELRAAMSLSRLWQEQGKQRQARQMLADIYSWFTEGFDTADLRAAKALLEELAG
jgi:predicted ATPase